MVARRVEPPYFFFAGFFFVADFFAAERVGLAIFLWPFEKIESQLSEYFLVAPTRTMDTVNGSCDES